MGIGGLVVLAAHREQARAEGVGQIAAGATGKGRGAVLAPVETPPPKIVEATFRNFGEPHAVFYNICWTARGELRIDDVYSPGRDGWSLRRMLKLDAERVRC